MSPRLIVTTMGLAIAAASAAGCASTSQYLPQWLSPGASSAAESEAPAAQPTPAVTAPADSAATAPHPAASPVGARPAEKDTSAPPKQVVVTLGESSDPGNEAKGAVDQAAAKLQKVDRARLTPAGAAVFDQASAFVGAARKSVADKDYPAAEGFAHKASTLLTKLESDAPNR